MKVIASDAGTSQKYLTRVANSTPKLSVLKDM